MGLFNTIVGPSAEHPALADDGIQFKWGYCRQYDYHVGDKIDWFGDRPSVADNALEVCGISGGPGTPVYFAVRIDDDVIIGFREISEAEFDQLDKSEPRVIDRAY